MVFDTKRIDDALIVPEPITEVATSKRQSMLPWLVAAFAVLALVAVSWYGFRPQPDSHWIGTRLSESVVAMSPRISPDGQLLAFLAMIDAKANEGLDCRLVVAVGRRPRPMRYSPWNAT